MFLMYSPDGTNVYGSRGWEFEWTESVYELKVGKGERPIHLFRDFCHRMYLLATIHFVTDG